MDETAQRVIRERLPANDDEAASRYLTYMSQDPFPEIDSALLNSADLIDYVIATGMIFPFHARAASLKPASYALPLLGKVLYWDWRSGKRKTTTIKPGDDFELQQNSIAFVTLEPMLRLPDYIAMRFNLKIRNVYRGLLLGTGPLVDPGFDGRLSIPLHNLTTNTYTFRGGDDLIWTEFTKLTPNERWNAKHERGEGRVGIYVPFAKDTIDRDVEDYVEEAVGRRHVISSISKALRVAEHAAKSTRLWTVGGALAAAALVVGLLTLIINVHNIQGDSANRNDLTRQEAEIARLENALDLAPTRAQFEEQTGRLQQLQAELRAVQRQLERQAG